MRKLFYLGIESYQSRYSYQLTDWNRRVFERRGIDYHLVDGGLLDNSETIVTGQVLDAHGRTFFSLTQMAELVRLMKAGQVTQDDVVYFEDMYTTGFDALGYILDQVPEQYRPRIYVRCLAQTVDPDDFLHVWSMTDWMRHYEAGANAIVGKSGGAVLASNEEMVANMRVAGWNVPIYNISGLAFGKAEVQSRVERINLFGARPHRVAFAARWDQEKQPGFFMDMIEEWHRRYPNMPVEFCVLSGAPELRSNNPQYVERAQQLEQQGRLKIYTNLKKNDYYALLNNSRVLFNCALQDWTSNTVSEADALGCNVLFPAYRSFPEVFANDHTRLYIPWSIDDALRKLHLLLQEQHMNTGLISDWTDKTIDRICDIMEGRGEQWRRESRNYRDHLAPPKY
jgi:hypothetical protein